ncbi:hypothetical protein SAMN05216184_101758 [Georgenia satyanarayanai]|uniref:Uncharacterized protein n=1 Tax=Georgenia satyanarayanai TaxID=860221 RepID=A0A2Y9A3P0_9MICO|nr:hypothetical protein [Georgenia satyanarayanai]PYG02286.1 hypothetical protein A8987_101758 [Georgenia satyanarayanai]SSA37139.1 hypothetical protein SAMN05216184_101758 [Georgenia satyanarayanai]
MTTDDAVCETTDAWGRPVLEEGPRYGPLDGDENAWPAQPMLVLSDEDVVACAVGFARAFSSEYFFTVWLIAVGPDGWTTRGAAELLDLPQRPPRDARHLLDHMGAELDGLSPGCAVVAAIASPDGGDRGAREVAWTRALLDAAGECHLPVLGIVAVGAHRARLLHATVPR